MESLPYPASPSRIRVLAIVSPTGTGRSMHTPQPDPAGHGPPSSRRACSVPHTITNRFGLAGAAGILAQVGAFLTPGQPGGGTGLLWDRTGRPAIQRAVTTQPARSSRRHPSPRGRLTWTRSPPNCSRWSNRPSNQPGCRCGCARPASHRRATGSSSNCRFDDTITFECRSSLTSAIARSAQRLS
jgi:hypothetical protein